jgi:D-alanine-D-alanine ligase
MRIGITYNLRSESKYLKGSFSAAEDAFEEFDSPETIIALCDVFNSLGHECVKLGFGKQAIDKIAASKIDFIFNIAEGYSGRSREAHMPALFEMMGTPYYGPDPFAAAITLDKITAKRIAAFLGVATPSYHIIKPFSEFNLKMIDFPAILKPAYEGSSKGIRNRSKVENIIEAEQLIAWLQRNYPNEPVIAEQFIAGREVTVGVIGNGSPEILGIMEIRPRDRDLKNFIYSLEVKRNYKTMVDYYCPAEISSSQKKMLERTALILYNAFGCRDISRFDFRVDEHGAPHFLEVNPLPGLNPVSGDIVIMARLQGIEYQELIKRIFSVALERCNLAHVCI